MAEERVQRRLAAILAADVVGYSRLMEADEAGTLAGLKQRRREILVPLVERHQGTIVKIMGEPRRSTVSRITVRICAPIKMRARYGVWPWLCTI